MSAFYIARQPILCASGETYGYELLFRSSNSNAYDPSVDGKTATSNVLFNAVVEVGMDNLVGNGLAFVNLTDDFLVSPDLLEILPPGRCVLEVLEDVIVTDEVVAGVEKLIAKGHVIALDDFVDKEQFARLLPLAQIIKYDITQHSMADLKAYRLEDEAAGRRSLVERVETHEEFEELCSYGFHYFQGYFFAKPKIISGAKLPANRVALVQLMAEINNPNSTIEELAEIVERDVSLGVRTLKYVNSPMNGLRAEVTSIQHAAVLLGRELISNWVTLLVMSQMDDKPSEVIKLALTRAKFCQQIADRNSLSTATYFTFGLLSLLDVFMGQSMQDALGSVAVSDDLHEELVNRTGEGGKMLGLLEAFEKGESINPTDTDEIEMGQIYQSAVAWSEETSGLLK